MILCKNMVQVHFRSSNFLNLKHRSFFHLKTPITERVLYLLNFYGYCTCSKEYNNGDVQGGIALTTPPCNKKQTSGLTEKGPVRLSNTRSEMGVVKQ